MIISKLRYDNLPSKHDSKLVSPCPSIHDFGSHLTRLFPVHGPFGHQTQSVPNIFFPKCTPERDSVEMRHDSLSLIWSQGLDELLSTQFLSKCVWIIVISLNIVNI